MKKIETYLLIVLLMQPVFLVYCQNNTNKILKAYELRMEGRSEEAINVLSEIIESDSTNAMAHFEMARSLDNDQKTYHITKALFYDPENLMYKFYQANLQMLEAYKAMKTDHKESITKNLNLCKETLKSIIAIKPDCKESLLFLIDIYGSLPEDMGGNMDMAKTYLKTLNSLDPLYAAQGEVILKSKELDFDRINYWETYIAVNGESNEALIKLGKACLMTNHRDKAQACFNKVIQRDAEQVILHLDVARSHLYEAMRGGENRDEELTKFKENIHLYLNTEMEKPRLIEAWCYGWLGMVEARQGNHKLADEYNAKAEKLIPNYPKFTAIPTVDQPPNEVTYQYKTYFSPF
ncbi:hypothetical protein K8354_11080 [Polaribacter litorisediminis]|uniref:tetratricopeptide repeat protein n=1 Tax=Polaribacter litorisediminis TaxID=1908341 RepID=UPI001CBEA64B|nr:hypothetical protein [Polaribacter litorisediminis]UAM96870.1 hypothetical protein K8354_11080 [Polaribacter litorisediminis]